MGGIVFFLTILVLVVEALFARIVRFPRPAKTPPETCGERCKTAARGRLPGPNLRLILSFSLMATVIAIGVLTRDYRDPVLLYQLAVARFDKTGGDAPRASRTIAQSPEIRQLLHLFDTCMSRFGHSVVFDNCESYKARLMGEQGMWGEMRPMLEGYLEDNPDTRMYAQALFWLGETSLHTGRRDDAERFFRRALFTWPPDDSVRMAGLSLEKIVGPLPLLKTAKELFASGKYLEAYNVYAALSLSPDENTRGQSILPLAYCSLRLNRLREASDLFVRWLSSNFNAPQSAQVKTDLNQCRAVLAYNEKRVRDVPHPLAVPA